MEKIIEHKSKTGSTVIMHSIINTPTSGTYADYILLKNYYAERDVDNVLDKVGWKIKLFHHWNFLLKETLIHNGLICVYCGKSNLVIAPANFKILDKSNMATVDHFHPISKEGDALDEDNMVVSCYKCNNKKDNNLWSIDTLKFITTKKKEYLINYLKNRQQWKI